MLIFHFHLSDWWCYTEQSCSSPCDLSANTSLEQHNDSSMVCCCETIYLQYSTSRTKQLFIWFVYRILSFWSYVDSLALDAFLVISCCIYLEKKSLFILLKTVSIHVYVCVWSSPSLPHKLLQGGIILLSPYMAEDIQKRDASKGNVWNPLKHTPIH